MYDTELMYDGKQIQQIEQIQLKFSKRMLGVRRQTSSLAVYGDTGQFLIIKYIVKIYYTLIWRLASMKNISEIAFFIALIFLAYVLLVSENGC